MYAVHYHICTNDECKKENITKPLITERNVFTNCYVNATSLLEYGNIIIKSLFSGQINNHAFALYWFIEWDDFNTTVPTTVTIYSETNGQVLWTNDGQDGVWALKLFGYTGIYTTSSTQDDRLIIHLDDNSRATIKITGS